MKGRHTALIFFLVLCRNCICNTYMNLVMTWSASEEGDQNRPPERRPKLPCFRSVQLGACRKDSDEREKDTKGKGIAVESSSVEAGTSTKGVPIEITKWTNEEIEDLLRYKYAHKVMRLSKGRHEGRDWKKIAALWSMKHGHIEPKALIDYAAYLRKRINKVAQKFDSLHPEERDIDWTDGLNEELIRIYYVTEEGDRSEHGERMLAEWVRSHSTYYWNVRGEYLLNRAKAMLHGVLKVTPSDLKGDQSSFRVPGKNLLLMKDHEDFLRELWKKYPMHTHRRRERLFHDAIVKFSELEPLGKVRLCDHAKYLNFKNIGLGETSGSKKEEVERKKSRGSMKKNPPFWNTEIDGTLSKLWEEKKKKNLRNGGLEQFHEIALKRIPALDVLTPLQVYGRVKYLKKRKAKREQAEAVSQESMRETHDPYQYSTGDQSMPWMTQGTYHHQEWIAGTSSHREPSHQEPYPNFGSDTIHFERQSPDINPDSD